MKRILALTLPVLLGLMVAGPVLAGAKPKATDAKAAAKPAGKMDKGAEVSKNGPVKGAIAGKMFTVAARGGDVKVDGSKAKVRDASGKFAKFDAIKPGMMVTVKGTMDGETLKAADIQLPKGKSGGDKGAMPGAAPKKGGKPAPVTPK